MNSKIKKVIILFFSYYIFMLIYIIAITVNNPTFTNADILNHTYVLYIILLCIFLYTLISIAIEEDLRGTIIKKFQEFRKKN